MLNSTKLLYIFPDAAYVAELLPAKKPHSFAIQAFRQVNGSFINEDEFIAENIEKLIKKIEPDEYQLILPDFLFTNTIVDVNQSSESGVKKYLKEELLPSLDISKDTHEVDTFILTQLGNKSKVQLSALEKSLLAPLQKSCEEQKVKITHISPLSWTIKSAISLEPSLSTIQLGEMMYISQHYIGIDQTISYSIEETANIIETVKTLKGAEPNIQTMYLLTNPLLENEIKEKLSGTLPIQQLANYTDDKEGIPAHIRQIIESSARTLDINDYPVPRFALGKFSGEVAATPTVKEEEANVIEEKVPTSIEKKEETKEAMIDTDLPTPTPPPSTPKGLMVTTEEEPETALPAPTVPEETTKPVPVKVEVDSLEESSVSSTEKKEEKVESSNIEPFSYPPVPKEESSPFDEMIVEKPAVAETIKPTEVAAVATMALAPKVTPSTPPLQPHPSFTPPKSLNKPVIKNKNDAAGLFRVVAVTAGALLATVVIGIGIGFTVLKMSERGSNALDHTPVVSGSAAPTASAAPSPIASPSPSPAAAIDKATLKVLIVNATTISGKAGRVKNTLTTAGYKNVDTGNAKGKYDDEGTFILTEAPNPTLESTLEADSELTLTPGTDKATEDAKGAYDVVIVLAE